MPDIQTGSPPPADASPMVSVVITTYDRPDFLEDALASVLGQSYRNIEIIVVDDCSPTDLFPVLGPAGVEIRYHRQPENGGANRARNAGVALARGELVAFLDDDDIWRADKVARQVAALDDREACLCGFGFIGSQNENVRTISGVTENILRRGNYICGTSGLLARRGALLSTPFDEALSNGQDWDIYVRLAQRGTIAYVAEPLFLRRFGEHDSISAKARKMRVEDIPRRAGAIYKHRVWLGEEWFRRRLASIALSYIGRKRGKVKFLLYSVRHAGLAATAWWLWFKAMRRDMKLSD